MESSSPRFTTSNAKASSIDPAPGDSIPVEVSRTFRAPVDRVWEAWSNADLIKQWWGPETYSCPEAKTDFRVGGKYLFAMKAPDGNLVWSGGQYDEIVPHRKIVYTDQFQTEDGTPVSAKHYGMPGNWPMTTTVTVEFEETDDQTAMRLVHTGLPVEMHEDCVVGWSTSIEKMRRLVERI